MRFFCFLLLFSIVAYNSNSVADVTIYQDPEYKAQQEATQPKVKKHKKAAKQTPTKTTNSVDYNNSTDIETAVINHESSKISSNSLGGDAQVKTDCDFEGSICLYSYVYKDKIVLEAENKTQSARTFMITYFLNNMRTAQNSDKRNTVLKSNERKIIDTLYPLDMNYSYGYNYNYRSYFGVLDAVHDDSYKYDLPFDIGQKYMLTQGVGGSFSHNNERNYYAYDFKMPVGTAVLAAREGVVVKVSDGLNQGGVDPSLKNKFNIIFIQHSDGTIGEYAHIKYKGSLVTVGDYVQKGQKIALSGNTGYSSNPHLHFGVLKVIRDGKFKSVPIKVKTKNGVLPKLIVKDSYEK